MNISYEYYRVFYYAAKYKSFTGAARALVNNQPNVTRMMRKLEEELGCTLFVRQRHGVALTPEGEKLYAHVAAAFEHIQCGEEEIARDRSLQGGIVTVAASEIALHCVLLPALKTFRQIYPGIRVRISSHSTPDAVEMLEHGLADFAVVIKPFELSQEFSAQKLQTIREVPVCSTVYGFPEGETLTAEQIKTCPLIGLGTQTASFTFYSQCFDRMGLSFVPDVEVATANQILPIVKAGLGLGFVPTEFLEEETDEHLAVLSMEPPIPDREIYLLKRRQSPLSIAASALERQIKSQMPAQNTAN